MSLRKQKNVILLKLVKNKEVLASNGGEKRERRNPVDIFVLKKKHTTLEHETFVTLVPGLGKSFV